MALPHVTAGEAARAAEQNALIDTVNDHATTLDDQAGTLGQHTSTLDTHAAQIAALQSDTVCVLRKNADQSIPNATDTTVTFQVAEMDTKTMRSGDTIVIPATGPYLIAGQVNFAPAGTGAGGEAIIYVQRGTAHISESAVAAFGQPTKVGGGLGNGLATSNVRRLNQGDVIRVLCYQNSGAARNARATSFGGCTFAVARLDR